MSYKYLAAKRFKFSAAHKLDKLPLGDPCGRVHGHTFYAEVVVGSNRLLDGMVIHFDLIRKAMDDVIYRLDHHYLNDIIDTPTTESVAAWIFNRIQHDVESVYGVKLVQVKVEEGPNNWATYSG